MKIKKALCPLLLTLAMSFSSAATANDVSTQSQVPSDQLTAKERAMLSNAAVNGFYVGVHYGYAWADWRSLKATGSHKDSSYLLNVLFGYQYSRKFSVDFGYTYLPSVNGMPVGSKTGTVDRYNFNLDAKLLIPITATVNAFVKAGLVYRSLSLDGDTSIVRPGFGVGISYYFNSNIAFDAVYSYTPGDGSLNSAGLPKVPALNQLAMGAAYHFNM